MEDQQDEDKDSCPSHSSDQWTSPTNEQENKTIQAIESCRLDFQSWQHVDIGCDKLVFEETSSGDPPPHLPLSVTDYLLLT